MPEQRLDIRMKLIRWLMVLALCFSAVQVRADSPSSPVSAEARFSKNQATVGDLLTYTITVRHDPGIHIAPPDPAEHLQKGFELVARKTPEPVAIDGQVEEKFQFHLRADQVGFHTVPPFAIAFTAPSPDDPSRAIPGTLQVPEAVMEIRSVLYQDHTEPTDIKDIKPIIGAGLDWHKYLKWVYIALGALGIIGLFFWWVQNRKPISRSTVVSAPDLTPQEIALAEIDRLTARKLIESGQVQEHYFELSEIFRRYLGAWLHIPALDWTTEEIVDYVSRARGPEPEQAQAIRTLLPAADQIKFAKALVDSQTASSHISAVRDFIDHTTPKSTSKYQIKRETAA